MEHTILKAVNIKRVFGKGKQAVHALDNINMQIEKGKLIILKGRSGSGKTTLLNLIGALDRPSEGSIVFNGINISMISEKERTHIRKSQMGFVFQSFGLVPLMSAYENVEFSLRIAGAARSQYRERVEDCLDFVGMKKRMKHRPFELSGGEQQRVAIARAIVHRPKLLLADEPTAELDSKMSLQVMNVFRKLVRDEGISIIMTTHDQEIMEFADHVYELEDGKIVS